MAPATRSKHGVTRSLRPARVRDHVSLSLLLYVAGLLVLVRGVEEAGLTAALVGWLAGLARGQVSALAAGLVGLVGVRTCQDTSPASLTAW
ncbi:MAG: hypothetical protein M3256_09755 [Actinomycetota bacterium]|nr:hypothetical protein [Actinomycetota bacterium]